MSCFILGVLLTLFSETTTITDPPPMLFHSADKGENWVPFTKGLPEEAVPRNIVTHGDDLWLVTDSDGLFVLPAGQNSWEPRTGDLPETVFATSIAVNGKFVAVGTYKAGVWISRDGGKHWYRSVFNLQNNAVWSLTFSEGMIIAGTDRGVYRSYDGGIAWMGDEVDYYQVSDLLQYDDRLFAARRNGILVSKDAGNTWIQVFDQRPIYKLTQHKGILYAFGGNTVFRSEDRGKTWKQAASDQPDTGLDSVQEALWRGKTINTPDNRSARSIFETSRGWFIGISPGC